MATGCYFSNLMEIKANKLFFYAKRDGTSEITGKVISKVESSWGLPV